MNRYSICDNCGCYAYEHGSVGCHNCECSSPAPVAELSVGRQVAWTVLLSLIVVVTLPLMLAQAVVDTVKPKR